LALRIKRKTYTAHVRNQGDGEDTQSEDGQGNKRNGEELA